MWLRLVRWLHVASFGSLASCGFVSLRVVSFGSFGFMWLRLVRLASCSFVWFFWLFVVLFGWKVVLNFARHQSSSTMDSQRTPSLNFLSCARTDGSESDWEVKHPGSGLPLLRSYVKRILRSQNGNTRLTRRPGLLGVSGKKHHIGNEQHVTGRIWK